MAEGEEDDGTSLRSTKYRRGSLQLVVTKKPPVSLGGLGMPGLSIYPKRLHEGRAKVFFQESET
ncbi:hypothetical protein RJ639_007523 [Escallonia herrerae]|uniref:Uncharacterized protein n=1 Tax=Escallonia herrerae TaxID=1293975 RepID=A0AA89AW20_9ASTE|nr:hypothetical protein RJ639_007523 [Escallonia herrerae]